MDKVKKEFLLLHEHMERTLDPSVSGTAKRLGLVVPADTACC